MKILFRVDASAAMGTGHVMRCLALAEALHDLGHACHFLSASLPAALERRLIDEGVVPHDLTDPASDRAAAHTLYMVSKLDASAVVVDGYHFDGAWRRALHQSAKVPVLALLDDADGPVPHADLVLNPAGTPRPDMKGCLFGADFVPLRRDIREAARMAPPAEVRPALLVTFGGSDPLNLTLPVTAALVRALDEPVPIVIVLGGAVADADQVAAAITRLSTGIAVARDVRAMGAIMARAGLAISAGGSTLGELAAMGVPTVVVTVADNQLAGAAGAARDGWCVVIDGRPAGASDHIARAAAILWREPQRRLELSRRTKGLVGTDGALNAARELVVQIERNHR